MSQGDTVKEAYDKAMADHPACMSDSGPCIKIAGDPNFAIPCTGENCNIPDDNFCPDGCCGDDCTPPEQDNLLSLKVVTSRGTEKFERITLIKHINSVTY